jgi:YidC/Oxa1 family membrane protein insertase
MRIFDLLITTPLMWIVELCTKIIPNDIIAMLLFALIVRLLLFPFSLWAQYQAVKLAKMKPQLDDIKAYYSHDWRLLMREQRKLYKKEKYSTIVTMLPLLLQIPVIMGVIRGVEQYGILDSTPANIGLPLLAAASAFTLCFVQNKCNVLAKEMKFMAKWGMAIFLTAFSFYFAYVAGIGFGIYWVGGNLLAAVVQLICNAILNPRKHITYEILPPAKKDKELIKRQKEREKIDVVRFNKAKKNLVFYSEASGFYKYFKGMINSVLDNSNVHVHYLTSDIDDQVFNIKHDRFHAYYCGPTKLITTLMKLDCKVCVMTMPDLQKYQFKRSIVNKNIEYVYVHHGFNSLTLTIRKQALDYFDTVFCFGKNYNDEIRAMEAFYGSKEKHLVDAGYDLYQQLKTNYKPKDIKQTNGKKTIIIAPSWQKGNILDSCIHEIMAELQDDYNVILRPHPEFIKRFPRKMELLKSKYKDAFQLDFSIDVLDADVVISDWSSIAWEFSYATNKPALFIDTEMKIMNPDWDKYGLTPLEISMRDKIGLTVRLNEINTIKDKLKAIEEIKNPRAEIEGIMYDNSQANEISGKYLYDAVVHGFEKQKQIAECAKDAAAKVAIIKEQPPKNVYKDIRISAKELAFIGMFTVMFVFNYFLFGQFDILLYNQGEFGVTLQEVWWTVILYSLLIMVSIFVGLSALCHFSKKWFAYVIAVAMGFVLASYIQILIMNHPKPYMWRIVVNLFIYIMIIAAPAVGLIFLRRYNRKKVDGVQKKHIAKTQMTEKKYLPMTCFVLAIIIFAMQFVGIITAIPTAAKAARGNELYYFSLDDTLRLSRNENIIVFALDSFGTDVADSVFTNHQHTADTFAGFTFYRDNISEYGYTFPSVVSMLTGEPFERTQKLVDYYERAWEDPTLFTALRDNNYMINAKPNAAHLFYDFKDIEHNFDNIRKLDASDRRPQRSRFFGAISLLTWTRRQGPDAIKFTTLRQAVGETAIIRNTPDYYAHRISNDADLDFYARLSTEGVSRRMVNGEYKDVELGLRFLNQEYGEDESQNVFSFVHLHASHNPYKFNENLQPVRRSTRTAQTRGTINILEEYFNQMRHMEIFEDSTIIVMADHAYSPSATGRARASLLIKRSGEGSNCTQAACNCNEATCTQTIMPLATDNESQLSHRNFIPTIKEILYEQSKDAYGRDNSEANRLLVESNKLTMDEAKTGNVSYFDVISRISCVDGTQIRWFHRIMYMNLNSCRYFWKYEIDGHSHLSSSWSRV